MKHTLRKLIFSIATTLTALTSTQGFCNDGALYWGPQNPCPAFLDESCPVSEYMIFSTDFLYLRALQTGFDEVINNNKWDYGYRIALDYTFYDSPWDMGVDWMHFNTHTSGSHGSGITKTTARWKIRLDVVNLRVGYDYFVLNSLAVKPYFGLRAARIKHDLSGHFVSPFRCISGTIAALDRDDSWKFGGAGPLLGVEVGTGFAEGFSAYGGLSFSLLYGWINTDINETQTIIAPTQVCDLDDSFQRQSCQTVFDASLGIQWETQILCNLQLILQLGLEHHQYFNLNRLGNYGDLCVDGGNFSVGFRF
ncbi:MAG: hypothetical protein H0X51_07180 [Parachlamydiaceae bacterium]|nr:hypothetical protein [Parachlamydiaceae bacterium]